MLKIISFKICPFVQRVTALLAAKGIPYQIEYISLSDKPQWFLDISPNGQVPVMVTDNGTALFESDAIIEYIDDVYPTLAADISPEQRAINRAWSYQAAKNYLLQCSTMRSPDQQTLEAKNEKLGKVFAKAEAALTGSRFFNGDQLGNVDIAWLPLLHRADIIRQHSGFDLLKGMPKVQAWQREIMAQEVVKQSVSEDFETLFTDFYLSDNTYLGRGESCEVLPIDNCKTGTCC